VSVRYLALANYVAIAVAVTGQDVITPVNATNTDLADSALHAPSASFGGQEFYPDFVDKAAVLVVRLAKTTRSPTATNERRGPHFASFSKSTAGSSTPTHP
jgi:hypothetical protein